jgi:hypothetical protein
MEDPIMHEGQWHLVEIRYALGTHATSRDGLYQVFVDGRPVIHLTNFNHSMLPWDRVGITPTWDGQCKNTAVWQPWNLSAWGYGMSSPNACIPWDDWYEYGHLHVSTTDAVVVTPPVNPPQPPTPPVNILTDLKVTNVGANSAFVTATVPAGHKLLVRVAPSPMNWGATIDQACQSSPCLVTGLQPSTKHQVMAVLYTGVLGSATFGPIASPLTFTTLAGPVPPVEPPVPPVPPVRPPVTGTLFKNIREENGALIAEFDDADCPKGTRRFIRGRDTKTITITCER